MMAQMQNIIDFPPTPKLDAFNRLNAARATPQELAGEKVFLGQGRCAECHMPQESFMDHQMHDLKLERFYRVGQVVNDFALMPDGPIFKTLTLRGIRDSPPYLHDRRLPTLAGHRRVLQPRARTEADAAGEGSAPGVHAHSVRSGHA